MNTPKEDMQYLAEKLEGFWLDLTEAIDKGDCGDIDLLCREIGANISVIKDLAFELKRKELVK